MQTVSLTHKEFAEAVEEVSKRSGRSIGDIAERFADRVKVETPEKPVSASERTSNLNHAAALARALGMNPSEAEALLAKESA